MDIIEMTSLAVSLSTAVFVFINSRLSRKSDEKRDEADLSLRREKQKEDSKRSDVDIMIKAATDLIIPLQNELMRMKVILINTNRRQDKLVGFIYDHLRERAVKLSGNPMCVSCIESDGSYKIQIQKILQNGDSETVPVK